MCTLFSYKPQFSSTDLNELQTKQQQHKTGQAADFACFFDSFCKVWSQLRNKLAIWKVKINNENDIECIIRII